jgi:hypothetical protein
MFALLRKFCGTSHAKNRGKLRVLFDLGLTGCKLLFEFKNNIEVSFLFFCSDHFSC